MPKLKAQDEVQEKEASHIELERSKAIPGKMSGPERFARMLLKAPSSEEGASGRSGISERAFTMRRIQRAVGNTMAMRFAASPAFSSTIQTKHLLQSKLTIGQPGDMYEQEADAAASRIASGKPVDPLSRTSSGGAPKLLNQRLEEETEDSSSERKTDPDTAERAISRSCAGAPLCPMMRERMEESFGADFSDVRVHTGQAAHEAAQALNARAFTHENHIYLARGESANDSSLMSHELAHTIQQSGKLLRLKDRSIPTGGSRSRINAPDLSAESGSDTLWRCPDFRQTLRLRQRFAYIGEDGTFQSHNFSPDLNSSIRSWLARRMRVFTDVANVDSVLRDLLTEFRRAHRVLGARVALRRGQRYTYAARIDLSGGTVEISDVRINDFSPTAERVLSRLASFPPMQWEPGGACTTDFCRWVIETTETPAPPLAATTNLNCWEAILLAAHYAGVVSWQWLHNLYDRYHSRGDIAFADMLSRGRRRVYAPPRHAPVRGDIVFFWTGNHLSHVGLATGRLNPRGASPEVLAFQGQYHEPRPPVRARVEEPGVRLSAGGRMRIEYARPPW